MEILVTGGRYPRNWDSLQAQNKENFIRFVSGEIIQLDWDSLSITNTIKYKSPPEVRNPSMMFKGGEIDRHNLNIVTNSELLVYDLRTWNIASRISLPSFNDLHGVMTIKDKFWIVNTGLELIQVVGKNNSKGQDFNMAGPDTWTRFDRKIDYRQVGSTKPHEMHINHLFSVGEDYYVTRMLKKDAICLQNIERRFDIAVGNPHDGVVMGKKIYFTTTNGHVVIFDSQSLQRILVIDLCELLKKSGLKADGWCRGILPISTHRVLVSFTQLRKTMFKEFVSWMKNIGQSPAPSRVVEFDLREKRAVKEFIVPGDQGMAIFSLLNYPEKL